MNATKRKVGRPKVAKPACIECGGRAAIMPKKDPRFCSLRCGYRRGLRHAEQEKYCEKHGWFNHATGCPQCLHEPGRESPVY